MSAKVAKDLLPDGHDVVFAEIEMTLARIVRDGRSKSGPTRALTATLIIVGKQERLVAAAEALDQLGETGGVRAILISEGTQAAPIARVTETSIAILGLAPRYLNNAVAALRLGSLPAVVWWRGGSADALGDLATLADRLVLDTVDPDVVWTHADTLFDRTALTDLRWTSLTRWRAAIAHLFDLHHVRRGADSVRTLTIDATDPFAARLFAGWLKSRLRWTPAVQIEIRLVKEEGPPPLLSVKLSGDGLDLALRARPGHTCLETTAGGAEPTSRVVPLGDGSLASLIGEELGVRTRDLAFEQALVTAREIPA